MQEAVVLFNGIHIPDSVTKRALAWAKDNHAALKAIFLQGGETDESYGFPSDLDRAQELSTTSDATTDDTQLIDAKRRIFESSAAIEN
ncbi:MAG: hypothetical protein H7Y31_08305, partial [Chitinophagaceae bacterium]|nr:hypothetical protein [Chitinophagaceae bacterium]